MLYGSVADPDMSIKKLVTDSEMKIIWLRILFFYYDINHFLLGICVNKVSIVLEKKQGQTVHKQRRCTERQIEESAKKQYTHKRNFRNVYKHIRNLHFRVRGQKKLTMTIVSI